VLRPGGTFMAQESGADSNAELHEIIAGPIPPGLRRSPKRSAGAARDAGLDVVDLRQESPPVEFYDIGAVVYFLRKVIWTIANFSVSRCRAELAALHEIIEADGSFVSHAERFLIEATKPDCQVSYGDWTVASSIRRPSDSALLSSRLPVSRWEDGRVGDGRVGDRRMGQSGRRGESGPQSAWLWYRSDMS
jgi:hypothetical protein